MTKNVNINVHHVTRVEGHGNILVNVKDGTIERCDWQVPESPRFFEAMVRGRHYSEVARIVSRICGICSVGHTLAAVKAVECALGIKETPQTTKLRTLLKHSENYDSHIVHVLFLAAPDLLGAKSVFPLVATHGEVVKKALKLKRFGHEWGSLIGGRTTHPTRAIPGGFSELPTRKEIENLKRRFTEEVLPDLSAILEVLNSLKGKFPSFSRETEYMALYNASEYGVYAGTQVQTVLPNGKKTLFDVADYLKITNEYVDPRSTAKYCKNQMESYMAGALARFNNHYDQLHPEAKKVAELLGLKPLCFNPYLNSVAQVVEVVHAVYESIRICDELLKDGIHEEELQKPTKWSSGAAACEVPRGILFHWYEFDQNGMCVRGDCIIPTNQNHANIQKDFEKLLPELLKADKGEKEIELAMEMLVRGYDPCISCSTHYLDITFKK